MAQKLTSISLSITAAAAAAAAILTRYWIHQLPLNEENIFIKFSKLLFS
jgi:hypothetical protein